MSNNSYLLPRIDSMFINDVTYLLLMANTSPPWLGTVRKQEWYALILLIVHWAERIMWAGMCNGLWFIKRSGCCWVVNVCLLQQIVPQIGEILSKLIGMILSQEVPIWGGGAYAVRNYRNIVDLITKYRCIVDTFHEITGLRLSRSLITEYRANFT